MNRVTKAIIFWLVIVVSSFLLWQTVKSGGTTAAISEISYSDFLTRIANGQVRSVTVTRNVVRAVDAKGGTFRVVTPTDQTAIIEALQQHGADIWFKETPEQSWPNWMLNLAPLILLAALWFFMIRQMQMRSLTRDGPPGFPPQESKPRFGS
jgi:cell division protease FtsH